MTIRKWIYMCAAVIVGVLAAAFHARSGPRSQNASPSGSPRQPGAAEHSTRVARGFQTRTSNDGTIVNVPGAPGYDPTRFRGILRISDIFAQEPRKEDWAGPVERWLTTRLTQDLKALVPEVSNVTAECRTSTCKLHWDGPRDALTKVKEVHAALYMGTGRTATGPNELILVYGGSFLADKSTPDQLMADLENYRKATLKDIAQDKWPLRKIEIAKWPKE